MQSSGLNIEESKEKFHFPQAPNTVKIGFCPACFAKRLFQPKLSVRPVPLTAAREPGHGSNLHYLGRRVLLLALLYYCTVRFMSLSTCICYINKHSSTLSYISQLTLIESYTELSLLWVSLLSMICVCECALAQVCVSERGRGRCWTLSVDFLVRLLEIVLTIFCFVKKS